MPHEINIANHLTHIHHIQWYMSLSPFQESRTKPSPEISVSDVLHWGLVTVEIKTFKKPKLSYKCSIFVHTLSPLRRIWSHSVMKQLERCQAFIQKYFHPLYKLMMVFECKSVIWNYFPSLELIWLLGRIFFTYFQTKVISSWFIWKLSVAFSKRVQS